MNRRERIHPFRESPQKVKIEGIKLLYGVPPFERRVSVCERVLWTMQRTKSSGRNKEYREVNNERDDYIATG